MECCLIKFTRFTLCNKYIVSFSCWCCCKENNNNNNNKIIISPSVPFRSFSFGGASYSCEPFDHLPNSFQLSYIIICQFLLPTHTHKIVCLKCYRIDDDEVEDEDEDEDDGGVVGDDNNGNNGCFLLLQNVSVHLRCCRCRCR